MRWLLLCCVLPLAALSGCLGDEELPAVDGPCADGCAFTSEDLPGLELSIIHRAQGRHHEADATLRNEGAMLYWFLWVPQCGLEPWSDRMQGRQGFVPPREPTSHCQPCGQDVLSPGEIATRTFTWDERYWDWDTESMRDAPAGSYNWLIYFQAEPEQNMVCGGQRTVRGELSLEVRR